MTLAAPVQPMWPGTAQAVVLRRALPALATRTWTVATAAAATGTGLAVERLVNANLGGAR